MKPLKRNSMGDYDAALRGLQVKYGIKPRPSMPGNPSDGFVGVKSIKTAETRSKALAKTASTPFDSWSYNVNRVYMEIINLGVGDEIEWYISGGATGTGPVMVLYRYENQPNYDFALTGIVESGAQHITTIFAYNDDFSGVHSRMTYTVPSGGGGYYAEMVFAYSSGTHGTATLTKKHKPSGGSWSTVNGGTISVLGHVVRNWGDFGNMRGAGYDDTNGTNSWVANTSYFPASSSEHYLNCMPFTGYYSIGSAHWEYYGQ